jgi:hypothetical protein
VKVWGSTDCTAGLCCLGLAMALSELCLSRLLREFVGPAVL